MNAIQVIKEMLLLCMVLCYNNMLMCLAMGACLKEPSAGGVACCLVERWEGIGLALRAIVFSTPIIETPIIMHPTMAAILDGYWH